MTKATTAALAESDEEVVDGFVPPLMRMAAKMSAAIFVERPVNGSAKTKKL